MIAAMTSPAMTAIGARANTVSCFFFFQAEDGIRDRTVTAVQTCALPICCALTGAAGLPARGRALPGCGLARPGRAGCFLARAGRCTACALSGGALSGGALAGEIGRASCRERGWVGGGDVVGEGESGLMGG